MTQLVVLVVIFALLCLDCEASKITLQAGRRTATLRSGLAWRDCSPPRIVSVTSTEHIAEVVRLAYEDSQRSGIQPLIRVTKNNFISHNNFSCPNGAQQAQQLTILDMGHMNAVTSITPDTVTVQAGITFEELEEQLLAHKLSLPGIVVAPTLASMTVGAAIVTAAHGSSLVGPASVSAFLTHAIIVDGNGHIRTLDKPGAILEGSLGMLGVVAEVTLEVEPAKKVAVKQLQEEDHEIVGDLREIIENSEAVSLDVTWSPAAGMYTARVWHETETQAHGEAQNVYMHGNKETLHATNRRLTQDQYDLHDDSGAMCQVLGEVTSSPHFSTNKGAPEGDIYGVSVGWVNRMAGMRCSGSESCFMQHAKWTPYQLSINSEDFADWVDDIRLIMSHAKGCPSFLFHLRFVMESESPMAMHSGQQVVSIEITTHSGLGSTMPIKHQGLFEEVVQLTLCKYAARPHWALGTNRMFLGPCPLRDSMGADWDVFAARQQQYDPAGLFVPPLWRDIEARSHGRMFPGCAITGDCYCQEDEHCGPRHKCVAGRVFKEYNVCIAEVWLRDANEL